MTDDMGTGTSGAAAGGARRRGVTVGGAKSRGAAALAAVTALGASGCASSGGGPAPPVAAAIAQPFEDLNLIGDDPAYALQRAHAAPYRTPADCPAAAREIAVLDVALAPHLRQDPAPGGQPAALAGDVIRSVARLPFRGIVRRLTGAERRAEAERAAVMAALQRRGYLKGWIAPPRCAKVADGAPAGPAPSPSVG